MRLRVIYFLIAGFISFNFFVGTSFALQGSGAQSDPLLITSFEDFEEFRTTPAYWAAGVFTRLETDIDLDPALQDRQAYTAAPIAGDENIHSNFYGIAYAGHFDGNGRVISNLTVNGAYNCGLFGLTYEGGSVSNLGLENCHVTGTGDRIGGLVGWSSSGIISNSYASGDISGPNEVGGLVGYSYYGSISNSYASGNVSGAHEVGGLVGSSYYGNISKSYASGDVSGADEVGGLVGWNYFGSISNSYAVGEVSGDYRVGGLVGYSYYGIISSSYAVGGVSSGDEVGGLVGHNGGIISNSYAGGQVSGADYVGGLVGHNPTGIISDSYAGGQVSGADYVGGLVGNNYGIISNSYADGDVSGGDSVGGLAGYNSRGSISNSYACGDVSGDDDVGGLVGYDGGSISNSYVSGDVSGDYRVGGLVGYTYGRISSSFWDTQTQTNGVTAGVGYGDGGGVTGLTTQLMQTHSTFTGASWDFVDETANGTHELWQMPATGGYPVLAVLNGYQPVVLQGDGSNTNPYLIDSAGKLGAVVHYNSAAHYKLTADIDLSSITWSTSVMPYFSGYFDGNGFVISNLMVNGISYCGLFGKMYSGGSVSNLGLENCNVTGAGDYVGGLVGEKYSGIISNSYVSGSVSGDDNVGGLVGYNSSGPISNSYAIGDVSGDDYVGGLAGYNRYGRISNSYASGDISGSDEVGGFVGYDSSGRISNSFWDTQTSGVTAGVGNGDVSGVAGLATQQMQTMATFVDAGWDYVLEADNGELDVWYQLAGEYPKLYWEADAGDMNCDGSVGMSDLALIAGDWLAPTTESYRSYGDVNYDGVSDLLDFAIFSGNW